LYRTAGFADEVRRLDVVADGSAGRYTIALSGEVEQKTRIAILGWLSRRASVHYGARPFPTVDGVASDCV